MNQSGIPSENSEHEQHCCIITGCSAITAHREHSRSKTHQRQDEKGNA